MEHRDGSKKVTSTPKKPAACAAPSPAHGPEAKGQPPAHGAPSSSFPSAPAQPQASPASADVAEVLTAEQIADLKARAAKADEHWQRLLRTAADFDNFKKRAARERHEAVAYANQTLLQKLIPVLDSFESALAAAQNSSDASRQSAQPFHDGLTMIYQQLRGVLADAGMEVVDALGQPFDPHWHEAVSQQETSAVPEGHVVQQLRKGYKLQNRLLRPASVVVAKPPAPAPATNPEPQRHAPQ